MGISGGLYAYEGRLIAFWFGQVNTFISSEQDMHLLHIVQTKDCHRFHIAHRPSLLASIPRRLTNLLIRST
jgi:hypothetical protein